MRSTSKLLALALAAALQPAFAAVEPISVGFDNINGAEYEDGVLQLKAQYKGVDFKGASWGVANGGCGGIVSFVERNGKCGGFLLAGDLTEPTPTPAETQTAIIDIAGGFITGSYLYYSALTDSGITIKAFEGLDGTGDSFDLGRLSTGGCQQSSARFCDWTKLEFVLGDAVARSLVISGIDNTVMLDDLFFVPTAVTQPGNELPEPGSVLLSLGALGALGWARKRSAR